MPNIVSTTTPAASNAQAMTLKALQQRMAEQQAQAGALSRPHVVTSIPQGLGDIANTFFNARRADYLQGQEKVTRDTLAKMRAGWGPEGPSQAQAAEYSALDPEEGNKVGDQSMAYAQAQATQKAGFANQRTLQDDSQTFQSGQTDKTLKQGMDIANMNDALVRSGRADMEVVPPDQLPPNWPAGTLRDKGTGVMTRPDAGVFNAPLAAPTAAAAAGAGDFITNADELEKRAAAGEGTGLATMANQLFGDKFGKNEVHAAIDGGISELLKLKGAEPGSTDEQAIRELYAAKPNDDKASLAQRIRDLKQALTVARGSLEAGREKTVVPGGGGGGGGGNAAVPQQGGEHTKEDIATTLANAQSYMADFEAKHPDPQERAMERARVDAFLKSKNYPGL